VAGHDTVAPEFRAARSEDLPTLLRLMEGFYRETDTRFQREAAGRALAVLAADPSLGRIFLIETGNETAGYVVLTLGFSLEFLGRDAFVDELFVSPEHRGRGLGLAALRFLESAAAALGVAALHLEVGPENETALGLYRRAGFEDRRHRLMTRRLTR
jgi:ribosomal protein S18 acetylase RimI-like enzyme